MPPFCPICGSKAHWSCDYSAEDFGYENCEGVIGCYSCSNEGCEAHIEVRDLYIGEETEERSIKYYYPEYDEDDTDNCKKQHDLCADVEHCLYCRSSLKTIESKPYKDHEDDGEGVLTIKKCNHCESIYEIEDIYPLEDIYGYPEDYLTPYDLRTVIVK